MFDLLGYDLVILPSLGKGGGGWVGDCFGFSKREVSLEVFYLGEGAGEEELMGVWAAVY